MSCLKEILHSDMRNHRYHNIPTRATVLITVKSCSIFVPRSVDGCFAIVRFFPMRGFKAICQNIFNLVDEFESIVVIKDDIRIERNV